MKHYSILSMGLPVIFLAGCNLTTSTSGVGQITSIDGNISCGWYHTACDHNYENSESATLTAVAAPHYEFIGWEGACGGTEDCTVSLSQPKSVTAVFKPLLDAPIPIEEVEFTDARLKTCVGFAADREGWVFNTDVSTLECKAQSGFVSDHGVSINSLEGVQIFPNLSSLFLRQRCYLTGPLVINQACEGPMPTEFSALSSLQLESLVIEGGWYERDVLIVRSSQYRIGSFPELAALKNLEVTGLISTKVPDVSNLHSLETYTVRRMGDDGFTSLGAIAEGAGESLSELTTLTSGLPCAEIDLAFSTHADLLINGKTVEDVHQCED